MRMRSLRAKKRTIERNMWRALARVKTAGPESVTYDSYRSDFGKVNKQLSASNGSIFLMQ